MEIVGAVALTLVFGYCALWCLAMAIPPLIGFDEFHIPAGIGILCLGSLPCIAWWFLVGSRLSINFN